MCVDMASMWGETGVLCHYTHSIYVPLSYVHNYALTVDHYEESWDLVFIWSQQLICAYPHWAMKYCKVCCVEDLLILYNIFYKTFTSGFKTVKILLYMSLNIHGICTSWNNRLSLPLYIKLLVVLLFRDSSSTPYKQGETCSDCKDSCNDGLCGMYNTLCNI